MFCYSVHTVSANSITLSGRGDILVYQQALQSVTYSNTAEEPANNVQRQIVFTVFDGQQTSNELTGNVRISLINDNNLMLLCNTGLSTFVEESPIPVYVAPSLRVIDRDLDHVVSMARVTLQNPQDGDRIQINGSIAGSLVVEQATGVNISISGEAMAAQYEVRIVQLTDASCALYGNH